MTSTPDPTRLLLLIDGECGFCQRVAAALLGDWFRADCDVRAFQQTDLSALGTNERSCGKTLHAITVDNQIFTGAAAVAAALSVSRRPWPWLAAVMMLPGICCLCEALYRLVANNRHRLPMGSFTCRNR